MVTMVRESFKVYWYTVDDVRYMVRNGKYRISKLI